MKKLIAAALLTTAVFVTPAAAAVIVDANSPGTSLGTFAAGQTYRFTVTGIVDLVGGAIPNGPFNLDADGVPQSPVTDPNYQYFNPSGSTTADGQSGPLPGVNFGALIANFGGSSPYFLIGSNLTTTFSQNGEIFARINDVNFNNSGAFAVEVAAIPEPATWALMLFGFGAVGFAMRRRARVRTRVTLA